MFTPTFKITIITFVTIMSQLYSQTLDASLNVPVKSMSPVDKNYAITSMINDDVYFYGFNQDLENQKLTDLDKNGFADWGGDNVFKLTYHPTGAVNGDDKVLKTELGGKGLLQQLGFNSGNVAFSVEILLKINGPQDCSYNAAWGMVNNNETDSTGSIFLIGDDHIQLGDKIISTPNNSKELNAFRYSYKPSGKENGCGTIFIYRNGKLLGSFTDRVAVMDPQYEWFGDWGEKLNGGYTIYGIAFTKGCYRQKDTLNPTLPEYTLSTINVGKITGRLHGCLGKTKVSVSNMQKVKIAIRGGGYKYKSPSNGKVFIAITLALKSGYSLSRLDYNLSTPTSLAPCIGIKKYGSIAFSKKENGFINKSSSKVIYVLLFEADPLQKKMKIVSNLKTTVKMNPLQFELTIEN